MRQTPHLKTTPLTHVTNVAAGATNVTIGGGQGVFVAFVARTATNATIDNSKNGGAEGIRTPDLLVANETRYQLRHSPKALAIIHPVATG